MAERRPLRFFIDHCVPESVSKALEGAGHEVIRLRMELAEDAPDPLVAAVSQMHGAILVSHDSDFRTLVPRSGVGRRRFARLSRIGLRCAPPRAAQRMTLALSLIEHEWEVAQQSNDKRMIVEIGDTSIRTIR